ncbi:MAG TPA: hypothetical protein VLE95_05540 [Chlamydiales bacterium]|nr:hypothetical protein [Chlamydiales bacterium]
MLELSSLRKNKVNLSDYNCNQDIENRMLMADFSALDLEILEEILFSPLKIFLKKFLKNRECGENVLKKLAKSGLFTIQGEYLIVDKEVRKYFEFQIVRFDPEFKPDMEFLAGLLRKVPIHQLPSWYSIPRSSNNIFESIVEKYLFTPQIFQRYLADLNFGESCLHNIISDLFNSPEFKIYSSDVITKYNLNRRDFEEMMLLLEFNFIGCVSYEKEDDHWIEAITPFYEWRQYLLFLKRTEPPRYPASSVVSFRKNDFAFIEDMSRILDLAAKTPLELPFWKPGAPIPQDILFELAPHFSLSIDTADRVRFAEKYVRAVLQKLLMIELASFSDQKLQIADGALSWQTLSLENRALYLYRHPKNRIVNDSLPPQMTTERNIREAEKSIKRVLHGDWVDCDEFLKGVLVTLSEYSVIQLKRTGKHWQYSLPTYSDGEKELLKGTIFEWLFEMGMVRIGKRAEKDCFAITSFGCFLFEE